MSAQWPSAISSAANLYTAVNLLTTTLSGNINSAVTTITLASTTGFPTAGGVTIDNEVIFYTGISGAQLTGCTRGADGTTAASHNSGVPVGATILAVHINALTAEVIAIETDLHSRFGYGSTAITVPSGVPTTFGDSVTFNAAIIGGLATSKSFAYWDGSSPAHLSGTAAVANGELLIGSNSAVPVKSTITGTSNQVTVTNGAGSITLSLPQSIATGSTPTFAGLNAGSSKITTLANGTASTDAAAFGQLKVLQTVTATSTTNFTTTSNTFQSTNLAATITPTSSSSRIIILINSQIKNPTMATVGYYITLDRSGTNLGAAGGLGIFQSSTGTIGIQLPFSMFFDDSPATTSSRTYTVKIRNDDNSTTMSFGLNALTQTMTLIEVQ